MSAFSRVRWTSTVGQGLPWMLNKTESLPSWHSVGIKSAKKQAITAQCDQGSDGSRTGAGRVGAVWGDVYNMTT